MVLLKMLMEIALPKMGELLVMMMMMISPSKREVPPAESLRRREKVSCPSSASRQRRSVPKVFSLFFLCQNDRYTRRWAPEVGLGEHNPPGHAWAPWCPSGLFPPSGPPLVLIDSKNSYLFLKILVKFSSFGVVRNEGNMP